MNEEQKTAAYNAIKNSVMYLWDFVRDPDAQIHRRIIQNARDYAGQVYDSLSIFDLTRLWGRNAFIEANFGKYLGKN